ncbi:MAG: helix-turn-helix transcriptional regulator [Kiritimatiellae bacterium]|jgi:y4mF family transcriptional regulator|nr:helix-turn-helix transcriptional regulator [Kiritimatiellia bacterium]
MNKLRDISAIGAKIRSIRKAQGVSQETLAGLAGTGQRYISELERGKETARIREMLKVLDALGAGLYIADQKEAVEWNPSTST